MITHTAATHDAGCGCSECASGKRNRYFRGKSMRAEAFRIEQRYGIERRRLLNRSIAGWGVVYGLRVTQGDPPKPTAVGPGLALDRHGRELVLESAATLGVDNTFIVDKARNCQLAPLDRVDPDGLYLLKIHYAERPSGDVPSPDDCGCDEPEKNFICETVAFSLTRLRRGKCPCEGCRCRRRCECPPDDYEAEDDYDDHTHGHDQDDDDRDSQDQSQTPRQTAPREQETPDVDQADPDSNGRDEHKRCGACGRGPHACLCHWVAETTAPDDDGKLCEWKGVWIDPTDGVPLACVRVWTTDDKCYPIGIGVVDDCSPRRIVKNNDLLYDLIRGCDTTRISDISWRQWHRSGDLVSWDDFAQMFTPEGPRPDKPRLARTEFVISFSAPVMTRTLLRDAITMTVFTIEQPSGWRIPRRVPILEIDKTPSRPLPAGLTDQIRLYVAYAWYHDEVEKDAESWLSRTGFVMEIEVHGDLILDCHRQAVDANAHGRSPAPSGNGTPGGTYISSFWVKPKPGPKYWNEIENA